MEHEARRGGGRCSDELVDGKPADYRYCCRCLSPWKGTKCWEFSVLPLLSENDASLGDWWCSLSPSTMLRHLRVWKTAFSEVLTFEPVPRNARVRNLLLVLQYMYNVGIHIINLLHSFLSLNLSFSLPFKQLYLTDKMFSSEGQQQGAGVSEDTGERVLFANWWNVPFRGSASLAFAGTTTGEVLWSTAVCLCAVHFVMLCYSLFLTFASDTFISVRKQQKEMCGFHVFFNLDGFSPFSMHMRSHLSLTSHLWWICNQRKPSLTRTCSPPWWMKGWMPLWIFGGHLITTPQILKFFSWWTWGERQFWRTPSKYCLTLITNTTRGHLR